MILLFITALLSIWVTIYIVVLKLAFKIIEAERKSDKKRFNIEINDYDFEKKMVTIKVTGFFITMPILFIIFYFTN